MVDIYIVVVHQGDYDEYNHRDLKAFKNKASADAYKHKAECVFQRLNEFYEKMADRPFDEQNMALHDTYFNKRTKYQPAIFSIDILQLI